MKRAVVSLGAITAACSIVAHGHGLLAKPKSKNTGNLSTSSTVTASTHFAIASFGIVDKAFFDGDNGITPWMRPGEFDYKMAHDLIPGHPQTLHPCGCNAGGPAYCAGVEQATGFGETMLPSSPENPPMVTPPDWIKGSNQETAWNAYANHSGGYIYMLCKKTDYDACRDTNFPNGSLLANDEQEDAYLNCVWDCFESTTLDWVPGSQKVQFQDDACTYASTEALTKVGKEGRVWRYTPIPDSNQVTNGGEGKCTWDSITGFSSNVAETEFTASFGSRNVCDNGRDAHNPKNWHVTDEVKVPEEIPEGEYLLSWRWDVYMADQLWTNCADVRIVSSVTASIPDNSFSIRGFASSDPECPIAPTSQPAAPSPPTTKAPSPSATMAPSLTPECADFKLTGNWGAGGHTCDTYEDLDGEAYCAHTVIEEACCFCGGGGVPEESLAPSPTPECTDNELSGNWGADGRTCNTYEVLGGSTYCAHTVIEEACCFCGGGVTVPISAAPTDEPSVTITGTIKFKLSKMSSNLSEEEAIAVVDALQGKLSTLLRSKKFAEKTNAEFVDIGLSWKKTIYNNKKKYITLNCIVELEYATYPEIAPLKKIKMKRRKLSVIKNLNKEKFKKLKYISSRLKVT